MHYAIEIVPFGEFGEPQAVLRLAQAAEAAGWEGLFLWDHLAYVFGWPGADPWVLLSAVAATTSRLKLGVDLTPLPRRRPQVLAHTLVTLDRLSQGRVIFGAAWEARTKNLRSSASRWTSSGAPPCWMRDWRCWMAGCGARRSTTRAAITPPKG